MSKTIRIGTRDSELALWQAHTVEKKLNDLGHKTEIIAVKSQGDIILDKPLYELGLKIGYSTGSHFIAAFKKKFATTPKKYLMSINPNMQ